MIQKGGNRQYAWDNLTIPVKILMIHVNGVEKEVDVSDIGHITHFKYPADMRSSAYKVMAIQVVADGPVLIVRVSSKKDLSRRMEITSRENTENFRRSSEVVSRERDKSSSRNELLFPSDIKRFESISDTNSITDRTSLEKKEDVEMFSFRVILEGISISIINRKMQELAYVSFKELDISYIEATTIQKLEFTLRWMQIDNQSYNGIEPIFIYPTILPREQNDIFRPVLLGTLTKSKDKSYGVEYYHFFSVLLQELSLDVDEDFLYALIDFFKFDVVGWEEVEGRLFNPSFEIPKPQSNDSESRMYFEKFLLQPIKLNVSFSRTNIDDKETRPRHTILSFIFDVFSMAVGNIHDAPLRMNVYSINLVA